MLYTTGFTITKATGQVVDFSENKLRKSLQHSGANKEEIDRVLKYVLANAYDKIPSKQVYKLAYKKLKNIKTVFASKYKLKKAIYQLGPSGFPFEHLVAIILNKSGYTTKVGEIIKGKCVKHEIDVLAKDKEKYVAIECKFHSNDDYICNIRIPLYIHSRYHDLKKGWNRSTPLKEVWIVTNTRFSSDAIEYSQCNGIKLLSWNYPENNGIKKRMNDLGFYPITVLTLLTKDEKQQLLKQNVVLCHELIQNHYLLNKIGVHEKRKQKIISEIKELCHKIEDKETKNH